MTKSKSLAIIMAAIIAVFLGAWSVTQRRADFRVETHPRAVLREMGITSSKRPQLAFSTAGVLYLLGVFPDHGRDRLGLTMSHDGGDTFTAPSFVSDAAADVAAHGENGPSLVQTSTAVYALWQQRSGDGPQQVMFARASGMGHAFDPPVVVTDKPQPSFNGFSSLGVAPNGNIYAVWLDGRARKPGTFDVYIAKSSDKGASFSKNFVASLGACPCCRPTIAFGDHGEVFVAFRKVFPGDVRDIVVATSTDGGETFSDPVKVADEHWVLHACPEAGPSLAFVGNKLMVAWFTESGGRAQIKIAASENGGKTFSVARDASAKVLDASHPVLSPSDNGGAVLAFQGRNPEGDANWAHVQPWIAEISANGVVSVPQAIPSAGSAAYPTLATASSGRAFLAWTQSTNAGSQIYFSRGRRH